MTLSLSSSVRPFFRSSVPFFISLVSLLSEVYLECYKVFKECSYQWESIGVSRVFVPGCCKEVLRVLTKNFKGVSRKFKGCFKEVSTVFQGSFWEISRVLQKSFKGVSTKIEGCFK